MYESEAEPPHPTKITEPSPRDFGAYPVYRQGASAWEEATEWLGRAVERSSHAPVFLGRLAWSQAACGRQDEARKTLDDLERRAATEYISPLFRAWAASELGDSERTRSFPAEAFAERNSLLVLPGVPCFRRLRDEPAMKDLAQRLLGARGADASR